MGMARRLGVGKVRHLDTALLWVQGHIRSGEVTLEKVLGSENPSDCLTKFVSSADMISHLKRMSLIFEDGRASSAPQLTASISQAVREHQKIVALPQACQQKVTSLSSADASTQSLCQQSSQREVP